MNIGVLGTGMVGRVISSKLIELGHTVKMGSRTAANETAAKWVKESGPNASQGTFEDAAKFGELLFNCTSGMFSLDALRSAGAQNLSEKILIDLANPLDFSKGTPPSLFVCNTDSLAEQIQREFPQAKVVKTLNTTNTLIMVNPSIVPGEHDLFVSGNDEGAKQEVTRLLKSFGWNSVLDMGDIKSARGTEMLFMMWFMLYGKFQSPNFNYKIVR